MDLRDRTEFLGNPSLVAPTAVQSAEILHLSGLFPLGILFDELTFIFFVHFSIVLFTSFLLIGESYFYILDTSTFLYVLKIVLPLQLHFFSLCL